MSKETIRCPKCNFDQEVGLAPDGKGPNFHECQECKEILVATTEGGRCCVICQFSDKKCPNNSQSS